MITLRSRRRRQRSPGPTLATPGVRDAILSASPEQPFIGLGPDGRPVYASGHVAVSSRTRGGVSTLLRCIAAQEVHHGATATIIDPHRVEHRWATGILGVELTGIEGAEAALIAAALLLSERGDAPGEHRRHLVVIDHFPLVAARLRSPAGAGSHPYRFADAIEALLLFGRAANIGLALGCGPNLAGPSCRGMILDNVTWVLGQVPRHAWGSVAWPAPWPARATAGQWHVIRVGGPVVAHGAFVTEAEARALASGASTDEGGR